MRRIVLARLLLLSLIAVLLVMWVACGKDETKQQADLERQQLKTQLENEQTQRSRLESTLRDAEQSSSTKTITFLCLGGGVALICFFLGIAVGSHAVARSRKEPPNVP